MLVQFGGEQVIRRLEQGVNRGLTVQIGITTFLWKLPFIDWVKAIKHLGKSLTHTTEPPTYWLPTVPQTCAKYDDMH